MSAITQSLLGFEKAVTVDVTRDLNFSTFKKQIKLLNDPLFKEKLILKTVYTEKQIQDKISLINQCTAFDSLFKLLNIVYIAPYQFESIENENNSFGYISSQVVLEHVAPSELLALFKNTKKWLTVTGIACTPLFRRSFHKSRIFSGQIYFGV